MTARRTTAGILPALLLGLLLGPACAQGTPPAPPDVRAGPEGSGAYTKPEETKPQETKPQETKPAETRAERQRNNAAKLAGLVAFVRAHCTDLRPDDDRFRGVIANLGVTPEDLQAGDLHLRAMTYAEVYAKDAPANCARATENFGPNGRTIPGLVVVR